MKKRRYYLKASSKDDDAEYEDAIYICEASESSIIFSIRAILDELCQDNCPFFFYEGVTEPPRGSIIRFDKIPTLEDIIKLKDLLLKG